MGLLKGLLPLNASNMNQKAEIPREVMIAQLFYTVLMRMLALFFLAYTIQYWMRLIGIFEGAEFRFDTMSPHWQAMSAILAVLLPVTAVGLWTLVSWGYVVWFITIACQTVMHGAMPELFGADTTLVVFHFSSLLVVLLFRLVLARMANKK